MLQVIDVLPTPLMADFTLTHSTTVPGEIDISLSGALPASGGEEIYAISGSCSAPSEAGR